MVTDPSQPAISTRAEDSDQVEDFFQLVLVLPLSCGHLCIGLVASPVVPRMGLGPSSSTFGDPPVLIREMPCRYRKQVVDRQPLADADFVQDLLHRLTRSSAQILLAP